MTRSACAQAPSASLTLSGAFATALQVNPTVRAASQQLAQAQAKTAQAQAQRRLQITFNSTVGGSNAHVLQPPPASETFGTLQNTLTVPVPLGAKPRLALVQAQAQREAASAQYAGARLALAQQVGAAFYDVLRKQALLQITADTLAQAQRELTDAQKRNAAGDVPELDVLRAQTPVASAQAALYGAQTTLAVSRQTLNGLLGRDLDVPVSVAEVSPVAPALSLTVTLTLAQARALAVQDSPDVRAADASMRAADAALQAARLYRQPDLSLQAIDLRTNDQTSFSREDTVQASVTVPLSDGGLGRAQVQEAEAALAGAQAQAQAARQAALIAVSGAYLTAQASRQQVNAATEAEAVAQASYDKTVLGYRSGLFPLTDVLSAQTALAQARIAATQALYDAAVANSVLANALGRETP